MKAFVWLMLACSCGGFWGAVLYEISGITFLGTIGFGIGFGAMLVFWGWAEKLKKQNNEMDYQEGVGHGTNTSGGNARH